MCQRRVGVGHDTCPTPESLIWGVSSMKTIVYNQVESEKLIIMAVLCVYRTFQIANHSQH